MFHRSLSTLEEFTAGDGTKLRELLHGPKDKLAARFSLAHARLAPGQTSHRHRLATSEVYFILAGRGRMEVNSEQQEALPGDTIYIPPGAVQRITNSGPDDLAFLCIVDPAWRPDDEQVLS